MPILYKTDKYAFHTEGESLTEQEHLSETDANIMIKRAAKGLSINTKNTGIYGFDDTTLDSVQMRIQKAQLEEELNETAKNIELNEKELAELERLAPSVAKKFKFRKKSMDPVLPKQDQHDPQKVTPPAPSQVPSSSNPS